MKQPSTTQGVQPGDRANAGSEEPGLESQGYGAAEHHYRLLGEITNEGIWVSDAAYKTRYVNRAMASMLGYTPEGMLGKPIADFLFAADTPFYEESDDGAEEADGKREFRFRRRDASTLWVIISARTLQDPQGRPDGVFAACTDITDRKRAEDALLESQTILKAIIESTSDMVWAVDLKTYGLLTYNQSLRKYLHSELGVQIYPGMRPEEMLPSQDFVERWRHFYQRALTGGPFNIEYTVFSGTRILQLNFSLLQRHGRVFGISVFAQDITSRKRTKARLRRQIAFEELINKLLAGFVKASAAEVDDLVCESLKEVCVFLGAEHANVIQLSSDSKYWSVTHEWSQEGYPRLRSRFQNIPLAEAPWASARLMAGESLQIHAVDDLPPEADFERERHLKEGFKSSLRVPLQGKGGVFKGCLGLFSFTREVKWNQEETRWLKILGDAIVTGLERKAAEEALRRSSDQLRALSFRLESLREEERTRISREIHDHLGQLLTALKFDLRSLERKSAGVGALEVKQALNEKIVSARALADEMITSVQKIASELRPGILDRLGLVPAIEFEVQAFQARTGIACSTALTVEPLMTSPEQTTAVFRILQELLTNIARHAHASHVILRLEKTSGHLVLEVQDNGVGMPANVLEDAKSLGLLGIRERAAIVRGEIQFTTENGQGTTAILQFPLTPNS